MYITFNSDTSYISCYFLETRAYSIAMLQFFGPEAHMRMFLAGQDVVGITSTANLVSYQVVT